MHVDYWMVGSDKPQLLSLTPREISKHLVQDWLPGTPLSLGTALFGWPAHITENVTKDGHQHLTLSSLLATSDRQWKGVISWMLGVAGARRVMEEEGYRWIAPLSAFYPNNRIHVAVGKSYPQIIKSQISALQRTNARSKLLPDYIAIKSSNAFRTGDWAICEAKGASFAVHSKSKCPKSWLDQVHSVEIKLKGASITIPRHLVIATRVNPNAKTSLARSIQIRAWNAREHGSVETDHTDAACEVVTLHLAGTYWNLGLRNTAEALVQATDLRNEIRMGRSQTTTRERRQRLEEQARDELLRYGNGRGKVIVSGSLFAQGGEISVELDSAITDLTESLITEDDPSSALSAIEKSERVLASRSDVPNRDTSDREGWNGGVRVVFRFTSPGF